MASAVYRSQVRRQLQNSNRFVRRARVEGPQGRNKEYSEIGQILEERLPVRETEVWQFLVQYRSPHGYTSVHVAARRDSAILIHNLHAHGADINEAAEGGWTPLHEAALSGNIAAIEALIHCGAKFNSTYRAICYNCTPLSIVLYSTANNRVEVLNFLLSRGANPLELDHSFFRETLAHAASRTKHNAACLEALLTHEPRLAFVRDTNMRTPLHIAAEAGNEVAMRILIDLGADMQARDVLDWTPLHRAWVAVAIAQIGGLTPVGEGRESDKGMGRRLRARDLLIQDQSDLDVRSHEGETPSQVAFRTRLQMMEILKKDTASYLGPRLRLWENAKTNYQSAWFVRR